MRYYKKLLLIGGSITSLISLDYTIQKYKESLISAIFKRSPFSISFTSVEGKIFFKRSLHFTNLQINHPQDEFSLEIDRLITKTSIFGLLFGPQFLFKTVEAISINGHVTKLKQNYIKWINRIRNIRLSDLNLKLGEETNDFNISLRIFDSGKYGLNGFSLFSNIQIDAFINDQPFKIVSVQGMKNTEKQGGNHEKLVEAKEGTNNDVLSFIQNLSAKKLLTTDDIPQIVKYWFHYCFSSILIRSPRFVHVEIDTETLLKVLLFLDVPFVHYVDKLHKEKSQGDSFKRKMRVEGYLKPGRNYELFGRISWNGFQFPRLVAESAREDQLCVFIHKLFMARSQFDTSVRVSYKFGLNLESDRVQELLAIFKVISSIYSVSFDETFGEK